ncbi:MAG TPA: UTRA domain-containing protein [Rhizomicrobium sp.]|jgi:DNA-binding GntR family transcriptional regulator
MKRSNPVPWWNKPIALGGQMHYLSVRDVIAARIAVGDLPKDGKLPSERQLQEGTGIARGTIREALFQLEAEGLIYRRDRSGWYVSPPPVVYDPTRWEGFMAYVTAQGRTPTTETLWKRQIKATQHLATVFGKPTGAPIYALRRRRSIDGRAVLVESIMVDPDLAPGLLEFPLDGSLTTVLKKEYGVSVSRNVVRMRPCALVKSEAEGLRVKSGLPGLNVVRTSYDAKGRIVEYDEEYWRHDAMAVQVDIGVR